MAKHTVESTAGKVISCEAAVCWGPGEKLKIEQIDVAPPQAGEVRIKVLYSTICQSDLLLIRSPLFASVYPRIAGHEAAGIVESVGDGVTDLAPGDHVLPLFLGECKHCDHCKSNKTNLCKDFGVDPGRGTMLSGDKKSRFSINGQTIFHGFSSTFSNYTVIEKEYVVKINPAAPMNKVVLLSCGAATGLGSVWNVAKVEPKSTVAVIGLGAVGCGAAEGARIAGASRIIGVDTVNSKLELGKKFGVTDFLNPNELDKPVEEVIKEMTNGGVDYAFECVGSTKLMTAAYDCCHDNWGMAIVNGVTSPKTTMEVQPYYLLRGRSLVGTMYGGWRPRSDIPELVERYLRNEFQVDSLITHNLPFSEINEAIALLVEGKSLRTVLTM